EAVEHLNARMNVSEVVEFLDQLPPDRDRLRTVLALLARMFSGPGLAAYAELWSASRSRPQLVDALHEADEVARDAVLSLFGQEIVSRAGPEFDALLDVTLYALRGMALDAQLSPDEEQRVRQQIIIGLAPYFESALEAPPQAEGS